MPKIEAYVRLPDSLVISPRTATYMAARVSNTVLTLVQDMGGRREDVMVVLEIACANVLHSVNAEKGTQSIEDVLASFADNIRSIYDFAKHEGVLQEGEPPDSVEDLP